MRTNELPANEVITLRPAGYGEESRTQPNQNSGSTAMGRDKQLALACGRLYAAKTGHFQPLAGQFRPEQLKQLKYDNTAAPCI